MEALKLEHLVDDLLRPILRFLDAYDLCNLVFCGSVALNQRIFRAGIVTIFHYRPKQPWKAKWPKLVHSLPGLIELDIQMPSYYEHMPLELSPVYELPKTLRRVEITCANANEILDARSWSKYPHLESLYLDGMRAPRPAVNIGPNMSSLTIVGFTSSFSDFGVLSCIDMDLFLDVPSISNLPLTLKSLRTLHLVVPTTDRDELEELATALVLPPSLTCLSISVQSSPIFIYNRFPISITDLKVAGMMMTSQQNSFILPPTLVHLSLKGSFEPLSLKFPSTLRSLKCPIALDAIHDLPPDITHLTLSGPRIPYSTLLLIPCSNLSHLKCQIADHIGPLVIPSTLQSFSCSAGGCELLQPISLPNRITALHCRIQFLDDFLLQHLPDTLTDLSLKVIQNSEWADWTSMLPRQLVNLSIAIHRGELQDGKLQWPNNLRHLSLSGFVSPPSFWSLPPSILSLDLEKCRMTDTEIVLSRIPQSATSFSMQELKILDEDAPRLPPRLVILKATLNLTEKGLKLLPKTLKKVSSFRKPVDPRWEEMVPEHCQLVGSRFW